MMSVTEPGSFDHIIVGGGSAGCVMANRLSAQGDVRVLLIEAGADFAPGSEPDDLRDRGMRTLMSPQYYWEDLTADDGTRAVPFLQAKVMGGGSSINGMHAQRGIPRDYDEWRQYGVEGWGWDDVLPYFKRLETDFDIAGPMHGAEGPVSICRVPEEKWSKFTKALRQALDIRGIPRLTDANGEDGDGTMPVPLSNTAVERASAAVSYLTKEVRARPNLRIMSQTKVAKVTFDGRRASGVELEDGQRIMSANVVICCGAIHSPGMLLRSGIGPAAELSEAGIEIVADRPGVGRNLRNHSAVSIMSHLSPAGRQRDLSVRPPVPMLARYSSNVPGCQSTDMQLNLWERNPGPLRHDPLNRQMSMLMLLLQKSYSQGDVRLDPANPMGPLRIRANLFSDHRDLVRMVEGFKLCMELLSTEPMAPLVNSSFVPYMIMGRAPDELTKRLLRDTLEARLISTVGAFAMDHVPGMRAKSMQQSGLDIRSILDEPEDRLADLVKSATNIGGHPGGTCRMGGVDSPEAVVDSHCRVIGVERLRVVDASIFPTLMNAGTNLPVMMSAEKVSAMIIQDCREETRSVGALIS